MKNRYKTLFLDIFYIYFVILIIITPQLVLKIHVLYCPLPLYYYIYVCIYCHILSS